MVRGPLGPLTTRLVTMAGAGIRRVVPACTSTTNGRGQAGGALVHGTVSASALSCADAETNAMMLPSPLMSGARLGRSTSGPPEATLTRDSAPVMRSNRNTSVTPLRSLETRLVASDSKTIQRPSPLILGLWLAPFG